MRTQSDVKTVETSPASTTPIFTTGALLVQRRGEWFRDPIPGGQDTNAKTQKPFVDKLAGSGDPGCTWPLFGEDQASGAAVPNERIDLLFVGGDVQRWLGLDPKVLSFYRSVM